MRRPRVKTVLHKGKFKAESGVGDGCERQEARDKARPPLTRKEEEAADEGLAAV